MNTQRPWFVFILLCLFSLAASLWLREGTDATPFVLFERLGSEVNRLLSGSSPQGARDQVAVSQSVATLDPGISQHERGGTSYLPPSDHSAHDSDVCGKPRTWPRTEVDAHPVYKWRDDNGQTHMSDQQPVGRVATLIDLGVTKRDFTYKIIPDGVTVPQGYEGQLYAGSKRIYDTWHFFLGEEKLRQSQISLLLIAGPDRFNAYHARVSPNSKPVNGFYSMSNNQAVVNFNAADLPRTLGTTFHEISHLITASHLGPTPPWLTEGLAEYFETMQVKDQSGVIHPNASHIDVLRRTPLPSLRAYLSIDRPQWYEGDRDRNYAIAWSLVHFLLEGAPGMYALQDVIKQAEANFCKPFSAADALDHAYRGGLRQLEVDWRKWLTNGEYKIHQT